MKPTSKMSKKNKYDIEHIVFLLKKMKEDFEDAGVYQIHPGGAKYLLGQTLRQIVLPDSNVFMSHKADVLWKKLRINTNDSIFDYVWQKRVVYEGEEPIEVLTYKGASKTPDNRLLNKGDYFHFRQVFHDEHIIPMKLIIDELTKLEDPNYNNVLEIISNISICRMLKVEDRKIRERYRRPFSLTEVIEVMYLGYGIYLKDYDYPHQRHLLEDDFEDSIHLCIPEEIIIRRLPHPESYGDSLVELPNGMITDIYTDEDGLILSITNDNEIIRYVMKMQEAFAGAKEC